MHRVCLLSAAGILAVSSAVFALAADHSSVEITVSAARSGGLPIRGKLVLRRDGEEAPLTLEIAPPPTDGDPMKATTVLSPGLWRISLDVAGYWAPRQSLEVKAGAVEPLRIELKAWPLGVLRGRVRAQGQKLPPHLIVTTLSAPKALARPEAPGGVMDCPIDAKTGEWQCRLPATTYDLSLGARGFIPHYRFGFTVPADKPAVVGDLVLEPGSSIAGWVVVDGGAIDPKQAVARLVPVVASGAETAAVLGLSQTTRSVPLGVEGLFRFDGIPIGSYSVEVEQPGYSIARSPVAMIRNQGEAVFVRDPLLLVRPFAISFVLHPERDPYGGNWTLSLTKADASLRYGEPVFAGQADSVGHLVAKGQTPGTYLLEIRDSRGSRLFLERDLPIEGETEREITLDLVDIEGTVALGDSPLAASLWFGGRRGAVSVALATDARGKFSGVLPRGGAWTVDVASENPRVRSKSWIEVHPDRDGHAEVKIKLPDTRARGRVVDDQGRPSPGAEIVAFAESGQTGPPVLEEADRNGAFEIRGLPPGLLTLAATGSTGAAAGWESDQVVIQLGENAGETLVTLILREEPLRHGIVTSSSGPVPGATVLATLQDPLLASGGRATTDFAGHFALRLPKEARRAQFVIGAPGFALTSAEVPLDSSGGASVIRLPVAPDSGDLTIVGARARISNEALAIWQDGRLLPLPFLENWSRSQGGTFATEASNWTLPNLAPGNYRVCALAVGGERGSSRSCVEGDLAPRASLLLDLPKAGG